MSQTSTETSDVQIAAIVNGVPVDRFGQPYLTRPSDFTLLIDLQKQKAKEEALKRQRFAHEHPELDERDSEDLYTVEQRKERKLLRNELVSLSEDTFHLKNHLQWLRDWQSNDFFTVEINKIDDAIARLVEFKRHLEKRHIDMDHTAETRATLKRKEARIAAIKSKLRSSNEVVKVKTEKKLAGLSAVDLELLMKATGFTREQIAALAGK